MEPSQQADLLLLEVGRAISAKNADTVRGAIAQLQSLLDTLKATDAAEETAEGDMGMKEARVPAPEPEPEPSPLPDPKPEDAPLKEVELVEYAPLVGAKA